MKVALAIDIGASSGRGIIGWKENGLLQIKEIFRFPNGVIQDNGHRMWDVDSLLNKVKETIRITMGQFEVETCSIDTWGVDYVLVSDDKAIPPCYSYRDDRTVSFIDEIHGKVPFSLLYERTGCQFQPFNTIYQLYVDQKSGKCSNATDFLMIPEYLMYRLTGRKIKEYTNATTTGLINCKTQEFDETLLKSLNLPRQLFPKVSQPGEVIGDLSNEVQKEVGGNCKVVLCATHDTASAVEGIPMVGNQLYISSGTWSLLGVKTAQPITTEDSRKANYSNEGGVGYNRYQKNIMGMWLVQQLREELCPNLQYEQILQETIESSFEEKIDCDDPSLLSPKSMKKAFDALLKHSCNKTFDYFKCAYNSLALGYSRAIREIEENTKQTYKEIYIVGGGAKNTYLNQMTEMYTNKKVIALPIEATALGNLKIQMESEL